MQSAWPATPSHTDLQSAAGMSSLTTLEELLQALSSSFHAFIFHGSLVFFLISVSLQGNSLTSVTPSHQQSFARGNLSGSGVTMVTRLHF